jgi:UDP-glucose:(heptosyl)LPS alpha-1,3-glucosyltransferase
MKIAILGRTFCRHAGGAETYAVEVAREMSATHDVHVFTQRTDRSIDGVTYHLIWRLSERPRWVNHLLFAWQTWRATRTGFDAVMSHELTWHGQIQIIHVRPVRYNLFHNINGWKKIFRGLKVLTSPRLMCYVLLESARFRAPHVVATSEFLAKECQTAYPKTQVTVIEPGVRMPDERIDKNDAKRMLNIKEDTPIALFIANDFERKGLNHLLEAWRFLKQDLEEKDSCFPMLLIVGGRQDHILKYKKITNEIGIYNDVKFVGALKNINLAFACSEFLVHPTLEDSFGMVVLEALSYGLPICVSSEYYCGITEKINHLPRVFIIENPYNSKNIASVVGRLILNYDSLIDSNNLEIDLINKNFQWSIVVQRFEKKLNIISV